MKIILFLLSLMLGTAQAGTLSDQIYQVASTETKIAPENMIVDLFGTGIDVRNYGVFYATTALCAAGDRAISSGFYAIGTTYLGIFRVTNPDGSREGFTLATTPLARVINFGSLPPRTTANTSVIAYCTKVN